MHKEPHPMAGMTVKVKPDVTHPQFEIAEKDFRLEDWWDRVSGKSWLLCDGNPACVIYARRSAVQEKYIPVDDEVVYGKIGGMGVLLHISEISNN